MKQKSSTAKSTVEKTSPSRLQRELSAGIIDLIRSEGLAPGTRWAELPDTWQCPLCGTAKADFDMIEL